MTATPEPSLSSTTDFQPAQVYQVLIKASAERIWEAITTPGFTQQYFHGARITVVPDSYRSLGPDGSVWGDEQVYEYDPPHRLVHSWRSLYDAEMGREPASRVTWEIEPQAAGHCRLTVTHDQLEHSPKTAHSVSGPGWMGVLHGLKTLLETTEPLRG
ncbi:MAG: SRPBCC domain-containing protein [Solirubrobacteraceae bacterium]